MYLESQHKENPLIPTNKEDYALFLTRYFQYVAKTDQTTILRPVLFNNQTKENLTDKIAALLKEHAELDKALEGRNYLANTFSIADIALIGLVAANVEVLGLDLKPFPNLQRWYQLMWTRPSVRDTCTFVDEVKKNFPNYQKVLLGATP